MLKRQRDIFWSELRQIRGLESSKRRPRITGTKWFFAEEVLLLSALFAVAADFGARRGDFDAAISFDLFLQLLVKLRLEFADGPASQASNVNVVARAVTLVEMLVATKMEQVELVDQTVAFEQINGAVNGHAVDARVELLRALKNGAGVEVTLGFVHHLEEDPSLACQAHAALFKRCLQASGTLMRVDAFAGGNSMCVG